VEGEPRFIIGIDEAGRGPLAGPVAVGAVLVSRDFDSSLVAEIKNKDSKKLSSQKREIWFQKIKDWKKQGLLKYHVALMSNTIIDTKGISYAIKKGIKECLHKLQAHNFECEILLDGSLKAPEAFIFQKTIIKGDEKHFQISLASIAAKVIRDRKMEQIAYKFPEYLFEVHKGYGTDIHRKMIKKYGPSKAHRKSFLTNIVKPTKA
jgi:ribonuclease HII